MEESLRFWENKGWINKIDPYDWFQSILVTGQVEDQKMIKDKLIDRKKLWIDLEVNEWKSLEMLVVNAWLFNFT